MTILKVSDVSKPKCQKTWHIWKEQLGKKHLTYKRAFYCSLLLSDWKV